jgi:hypothetical protein
MAEQIKKNEKVVIPHFKNGPTLQFFTLTFPSTVAAKLGATAAGVRSPVVAALDAIAQVCSIEIIGSLKNSGTELTVGVVAIGGDFGSAKWDGTNTDTFAEHLEDLVQASGNLQSVNNASTTVTAGILTAGAI